MRGPVSPPNADQPGGEPGIAHAAMSKRFEDELRASIDSVREGLQLLHLQKSTDTIRGADRTGAFPIAAVQSVPPIIVDANVIRNDVIYASKLENQYTTLVNATNAGYLRLFCARHVLDEVAEHYVEWCSQAKIAPSRFQETWVQNYVPLIHLVPTLPNNLLSSNETRRIEELKRVDSDDVPSVTLALLIGGVYLSQDGPATTAVYGEGRTQNELQKWRAILAAGGNVGTFSSLFEASILLGRLARGGLGGLAGMFAASPPWLQGIFVGAAGATLGGLSSLESTRSFPLRDVAWRMFKLIVAASAEYESAMLHLQRACAPAPPLLQLAQERTSSQLLTRVVLHELARSRHGLLSAVEIARMLPDLPVAQSEHRVREVLRSQTSARERQRGRWQLGDPVSWPPRQDLCQ
jgi:predicted nucleic acid-binding protein